MQIGKGTVICDSARVVGRVKTGVDCFILFGAVLRGDGGTIELGDRVNVQDNAVGHSDPEFPLILGNDVSVGHGAVVHGCRVGPNTIVGMNATILNGAVIGRGCIVGAGAVVGEGVVVPDHSLVVGVPAKVVRKNEAFEQRGALNAAVYNDLRAEYQGKKHFIYGNAKL